MVSYLQSYQMIGDSSVRGLWKPFLIFSITLAVNIYVVSRGILAGIEKPAKIGMPIVFIFAAILAVVILTMDPLTPGGPAPSDGLNFFFNPDFSQLSRPGLWLAAAGQIFFTLSVGMDAPQSYASYLTQKDDLVLSGLATAATNETADVVLGGSIAIPAAVVFFGVAGALQVASSGSFKIGFATMPVVFQQLPLGNVFGVMWFGLLFFAGFTSSVAMATPIVAFFREEFGIRSDCCRSSGCSTACSTSGTTGAVRSGWCFLRPSKSCSLYGCSSRTARGSRCIRVRISACRACSSSS